MNDFVWNFYDLITIVYGEKESPKTRSYRIEFLFDALRFELIFMDLEGIHFSFNAVLFTRLGTGINLDLWKA